MSGEEGLPCRGGACLCYCCCFGKDLQNELMTGTYVIRSIHMTCIFVLIIVCLVIAPGTFALSIVYLLLQEGALSYRAGWRDIICNQWSEESTNACKCANDEQVTSVMP